MALTRMTIDGFGQLELNNAAFPRDGRVEAQCALDATDFASIPAENGMLLAVDKLNGVIKIATDATLPIAINYSAEHLYDERALGLKDFKLTPNDFYPRLGYLSVGDKFTTNCIAYDTGDFADDTALDTALKAIKTTPLYGGIGANGAIVLDTTKPSAGPVLKVIKYTTMPDGQPAVKFQVLSV